MDSECKKHVLEENKRFSESMLWDLQRQAYTTFGPQAWVDKGVPSYLTSNPYTVRQFARVVEGYVHDCIRNKLVDRNEPLYIFDLGAGSGRFGFLFIKYFLQVIKHLYGKVLQVRYIMTDIVEGNIDFLKKHDSLKPFVDEGTLDFALFSHDHTGPIKLLSSGETLSELKNPAVIICNYFFDTIPQDFFRIHDGKLEEGRISLFVDEAVAHLEESQVIENLEAQYAYVPIIDPSSYYSGDTALSEVLSEYLKTFGDLSFLFPCGAFQVIHYFRNLANDKLLILAGDQGVVTEQQMREWGEPRIDKHGTFSIPVSYHAIGTYIRQQGGTPLMTSLSDPLFVVMSGVVRGNRHEYRETALAFEQTLDTFEPKDYWKLASFEEKQQEELSLDMITLILKFGCWDPVNFNVLFETIRKRLSESDIAKKKEFFPVILRVYENFYPMTKDDGNFIVNLGVLSFDIGEYVQALEFFNQALSMMGDSPLVFRNISACYQKMSRQQQAFEYLDKAIKLEK